MKCLSSSLCCSWHSVFYSAAWESCELGVCVEAVEIGGELEKELREQCSLPYATRGSLQGVFISELFCMKLAPVPTLLSG